MGMSNLFFLAFLHSIGLTQKALSRIFAIEENYEDFYNTLNFRVLERHGLRPEKIQSILKMKEELDTDKIVAHIEKLSIQIITIKDRTYPELLRQTPICPFLLYVRGILPIHENLISIVGSRKSTSYSRTTLVDIIPELVHR